MSPNNTEKDFSILDPSKEIEVDSDLSLEGDMMEMTKQVEEKIQNTYEEATPIRMYPVKKNTKDLIEYRKKRNKKKKAAKQSRKINRKK